MAHTDETRRAAVRRALEAYEAPLIRYATRMTGDLDRAREIVQETFLRLCAEDPKPQGNHLGSWLYTVCRNRALDVCEKEQRMRLLDDQSVLDRGSSKQDPAHIAESQEGYGRVQRALALLPENQQEVLRLRFQGGLSYKEIASVTQLSVSNVGYLIHVGIKAVREFLKDQGSEQAVQSCERQVEHEH